jgi:hypothetical protein
MAVIHRADPAITLVHGNHDVTSLGLVTVRGWYPFEVLHFPLRTLEQSRRKFRHKVQALRVEPTDMGRHSSSAGRALAVDSYEDWYASYVIEDSAVTTGVADGSLVVDTRLRDALRSLAGVDALPSSPSLRFPLPGEAPCLAFPLPSLGEEARYADEMQVYDDLDSQAEMHRRVRRVERRVEELERARGGVVSRFGARRPA